MSGLQNKEFSAMKTLTTIGDASIVLLIFLLSLLFHSRGFAMGFFSSKLCVFSEVEGIVTINDKPVEGAIIKRSYLLDDDEVFDQTSSDKNGKFQLDPIFVKSFRSFYPHQAAILQEINLIVDEVSYQAYGFQKGNYKENGERGDKPLLLRCELTNEKQRRPISESQKYFGICELVDNF